MAIQRLGGCESRETSPSYFFFGRLRANEGSSSHEKGEVVEWMSLFRVRVFVVSLLTQFCRSVVAEIG